MERKNVNHAYPYRLWRQLKRLADKTDMKLTTYVNQVLRKHVEENKKIPKKQHTCSHPLDKRHSWHDDAILCVKCDCIIEQNGEKIDPPYPLNGY